MKKYLNSDGQQIHYERNVETMIVKYYTNINKTNNHFSPQIIEHEKKTTRFDGRNKLIPSSPSFFCNSKFIPCNFPIDEVKDKFCLIYEIKISILFL
jgi:hypothetical protein